MAAWDDALARVGGALRWPHRPAVAVGAERRARAADGDETAVDGVVVVRRHLLVEVGGGQELPIVVAALARPREPGPVRAELGGAALRRGCHLVRRAVAGGARRPRHRGLCAEPLRVAGGAEGVHCIRVTLTTGEVCARRAGPRLAV